jgi:hypothetical protein
MILRQQDILPKVLGSVYQSQSRHQVHDRPTSFMRVEGYKNHVRLRTRRMQESSGPPWSRFPQMYLGMYLECLEDCGRVKEIDW